MGILLMTGVLVALSVIAVRFGADTRDSSASGWFERSHHNNRKDIGAT
jgi:hypothetical protein